MMFYLINSEKKSTLLSVNFFSFVVSITGMLHAEGKASSNGLTLQSQSITVSPNPVPSSTISIGTIKKKQQNSGNINPLLMNQTAFHNNSSDLPEVSRMMYLLDICANLVETLFVQFDPVYLIVFEEVLNKNSLKVENVPCVSANIVNLIFLKEKLKHMIDMKKSVVKQQQSHFPHHFKTTSFANVHKKPQSGYPKNYDCDSHDISRETTLKVDGMKKKGLSLCDGMEVHSQSLYLEPNRNYNAQKEGVPLVINPISNIGSSQQIHNNKTNGSSISSHNSLEYAQNSIMLAFCPSLPNPINQKDLNRDSSKTIPKSFSSCRESAIHEDIPEKSVQYHNPAHNSVPTYRSSHINSLGQGTSIRNIYKVPVSPPPRVNSIFQNCTSPEKSEKSCNKEQLHSSKFNSSFIDWIPSSICFESTFKPGWVCNQKTPNDSTHPQIVDPESRTTYSYLPINSSLSNDRFGNPYSHLSTFHEKSQNSKDTKILQKDVNMKIHSGHRSSLFLSDSTAVLNSSSSFVSHIEPRSPLKENLNIIGPYCYPFNTFQVCSTGLNGKDLSSCSNIRDSSELPRSPRQEKSPNKGINSNKQNNYILGSFEDGKKFDEKTNDIQPKEKQRFSFMGKLKSTLRKPKPLLS